MANPDFAVAPDTPELRRVLSHLPLFCAAHPNPQPMDATGFALLPGGALAAVFACIHPSCCRGEAWAARSDGLPVLVWKIDFTMPPRAAAAAR